MIDNTALDKINSDRAVEIFTGLYGKDEVDAARLRYSSLITQFNSLPESELCSTDGALRFFSSPGRTELAGNHTDHNRGKVLAASIQLDSAAVVKKRSDNIVFFRSAGFPDVKIKLTNEDNKPALAPKPEESGTTEALVRGIAAEFHKRGCLAGGFSACAESTVLPGSGLSSSAALEVLTGRIFDSLYDSGKKSALEIAQIGQIAENQYFGKPCGLMDQTACAAGGAVAIDFADALKPIVKQINFDLDSAAYILCVVNTGGSHADLTSDYASIPSEMKSVAAFFGKTVLREINMEILTGSAKEIRKTLGDRALLRAIHFFDENVRVDAMTETLQEMEKTASGSLKQKSLCQYMDMVNESGDSSWELLQNVFSPGCPRNQGIAAALALTKDFFRRQKIRGACRVHGGGFAGTIQAYLPKDAFKTFRARIESVFGEGSVTPLRIRPVGAAELIF